MSGLSTPQGSYINDFDDIPVHLPVRFFIKCKENLGTPMKRAPLRRGMWTAYAKILLSVTGRVKYNQQVSKTISSLLEWLKTMKLNQPSAVLAAKFFLRVRERL